MRKFVGSFSKKWAPLPAAANCATCKRAQIRQKELAGRTSRFPAHSLRAVRPQSFQSHISLEPRAQMGVADLHVTRACLSPKSEPPDQPVPSNMADPCHRCLFKFQIIKIK